MKDYKGAERRRYIRLKSVFPVEFKLLSPNLAEELSGLKQGFTADVSKGGILLRINSVEPDVLSALKRDGTKLTLNINIPIYSKSIKAISGIAWMKVITKSEGELCLLGLSFEEISDKDRKTLVGHAKSLYRTPILVALALIVMLMSIGINRIEEVSLKKENTVLIEQLADVVQRRTDLVGWLDKADADKEILLATLKDHTKSIREAQIEQEKLIAKEEELKSTVIDLETLKKELAISKNAQGVLGKKLGNLSRDKDRLQNRLAIITHNEQERLKEFAIVETARLSLEKATVDNMYNWMKVHQNRKTGLIASYEGDPALKNTAFIYDQSIVAQVFILNRDFESAKAILDFFKDRAPRTSNAFANAYGVNSGGITEYTVHCGPNIWLGIALMQYMNQTGTHEYLDLAKQIGDWVIGVQGLDPDGGIKGGPEVTWYSTEHNLDAYAYFIMLYKVTDEEKYKEAAKKSLVWIKKNTYTGDSGRIRRGKGDSTIATDTFAWAIASIGPAMLTRIEMDPDAIMKYAEDNCKVTVDFVRPDGKTVMVTGFDFAKHKNIGRGGVVSSEWTAQMIVALKMMSDFYLDSGDKIKARHYRKKYTFYLSELEKMVIASPSRTGQGAGCLPYASHDDVDTGHGWRTPRGRDTGSVSGTAYGIFAMKGFNPLKLAASKK
ncbi:MAG: PilZ domain-containing protein [Candidatus Omnitrophica bacterium]|nr:PilZ domain-containing protein [Candidatus Omnitrophota bacterium]